MLGPPDKLDFSRYRDSDASISSTMTIWLELDRTCAVVTQRSNICGMPRASEVENAGVHVCMTVESVRSASTKQEPVFVIPRPEEPIFFNLPAQTHISHLTKSAQAARWRHDVVHTAAAPPHGMTHHFTNPMHDPVGNPPINLASREPTRPDSGPTNAPATSDKSNHQQAACGQRPATAPCRPAGR